jgi:hypothetical protein
VTEITLLAHDTDWYRREMWLRLMTALSPAKAGDLITQQFNRLINGLGRRLFASHDRKRAKPRTTSVQRRPMSARSVLQRTLQRRQWRGLRSFLRWPVKRRYPPFAGC